MKQIKSLLLKLTYGLTPRAKVGKDYLRAMKAYKNSDVKCLLKN